MKIYFKDSSGMVRCVESSQPLPDLLENINMGCVHMHKLINVHTNIESKGAVLAVIK